jgi:hypothetical protein
MAKKKILIVVAVLAVLLVIAALLATRLRSPTGAATGGASGCGGGPAEMEQGTKMTALDLGEFEPGKLATLVASGAPVSSFEGELAAYLFDLYKFVGHEEVFLAPSWKWVSAEEMAEMYGKKYELDGANLPLGTLRHQGGEITVILRSEITMGEAMRAVHHELGDVHSYLTTKNKDFKGQYWSELSRVFMLMAAVAHDPQIGGSLVLSLPNPLPQTAAEMNDYHMGYVLAMHLLAATGFDLEAAQEVLQAKTLKELDEMAVAAVVTTPTESVLDSLVTIGQGNQFNFPTAYVEYVAAVVLATDLHPRMLAAYGTGDKIEAAALAKAVVEALTPVPSADFPYVWDRQVIAYNILALLHIEGGNNETVRLITDAYWSKFETYLTGQEVDSAFKECGPSTLFARAAAEANLDSKDKCALWAGRVLAFEPWYDYAPEALGAEYLQRASDLQKKCSNN